MTKYLGVDYGLAHVGLASAEEILATPLFSLPNDQKLLLRLKQIVESEGVGLVVCGIPEGSLTGPVTQFAQKLEKILGIKVVLYPETLSTHEAIEQLHQAKASRKKLQNDHAYAAALILEDYLEFGK